MHYLSAILPLFSAVLYLCLGISVYFLSKSALRKVLLRFTIIVFHWQFSWVVLFTWNNAEYAELICRIGYSGIIFLPISCYETVVRYMELPHRHIRWFYYIGFGFLVSLWTTDFFIKGAKSQWFGFYPEAGFLHVAYLVLIIICIIIVSTFVPQISKQSTDPIKKKQLKFFYIATIIFSFSGIDYLLNYPWLVEKLNLQLYPVGVFFISFSVLVFVLSHFITLNLTLEKRVAIKTAQLKDSVNALEESARLKKDFIANITHELRTPLTVIRGWTDYILEGEAGKIPAKLSEIIDKVSLQTLNLTDKINELLKVSRFDAGMTRLVLTKTDINLSIEQLVNSFKGLTDKRNIGLSFHGDPSISTLFVDQEKLKDILNNLIRNAYKFTEEGEIVVSLNHQPGNFVIMVKDTGVGISTGILDGIFQRFRQEDSSKTRMYEGTGLGLSIVRDCVQLMHGKISVDSKPGEGSEFSISIPIDLEKREPKAVKEDRMTERRKRVNAIFPNERRKKDRRINDLAGISNEDIAKILESETPTGSDKSIIRTEPDNSKGLVVIAEDNKAIQQFFIEALKEYSLIIASDGQTAWLEIQDTMPDLVISDIMMPIMDGYALLEKIRTSEKTTSLPVIIITALTEQDDRIKSLQLGADDYLTKPFHHIELQARVKNVISVHRLEREKAKTEQLEVFLMVLSSVIESKDKYTGGHVERVAGYARDIARKADLGQSLVRDVYLGTIVHDVGKISIKDSILNKPGKLTSEEFKAIKEHPTVGKGLLEKLEIAPVAVNIAYYHQEKWDGTGYPEGLSKTDIPIEARIAAIADVWDAITSDRPYRKAIPLEKAVAIMHDERGKSFDPELFDLFMDEKEKLYLKYFKIN